MMSQPFKDLLISNRPELVSSIVIRELLMAELVSKHVITDEEKEIMCVSRQGRLGNDIYIYIYIKILLR